MKRIVRIIMIADENSCCTSLWHCKTNNKFNAAASNVCRTFYYYYYYYWVSPASEVGNNAVSAGGTYSTEYRVQSS